MATIPAPLFLANASTLLAWLCAYVPHEVLLALLFCAVVSIVVITLLIIVTYARCVTALYDYVTKTRSRKLQYRTQPPRQHAPRVNYGSPAPRHSFHPFQPSYQCPHCQGCLAMPPWSLRKPGLELWAPALVSDRSPQRRASDTTPETKSFVSFEPSDTDIEPQITTPPRGSPHDVEPLIGCRELSGGVHARADGLSGRCARVCVYVHVPGFLGRARSSGTPRQSRGTAITPWGTW